MQAESPDFRRFCTDRIICWEAGVEPKLGQGKESINAMGTSLRKSQQVKLWGVGGPGWQCREEGALVALELEEALILTLPLTLRLCCFSLSFSFLQYKMGW